MARPRPSVRFPTLAAYIAGTGVAQATIAREVGTSQANISRIARGDLVPRPRLAARLAAFAKIPLEWFVRVRLEKRRTP